MFGNCFIIRFTLIFLRVPPKDDPHFEIRQTRIIYASPFLHLLIYFLSTLVISGIYQVIYAYIYIYIYIYISELILGIQDLGAIFRENF